MTPHAHRLAMRNTWRALAPALEMAAAVQAPAAYLRHLASRQAEYMCMSWSGGSVSVALGGPIPSNARRLLDQWAEGWRPEIPHLLPMLAMGAWVQQVLDLDRLCPVPPSAMISRYEKALFGRLEEIARSTSTVDR